MGYYKWLVGITGLFLVHALACMTNASAEYIQFTFTGEVTEIVGQPWDPWPDAQLGDEVQIQYIVDSNAEDQAPFNPYGGRYDFLDFTFSLNNVALATSEGFVDLDYDPFFQDYYILHSNFGNGLFANILFTGADMLFSDELPLDIDWTQYASTHFGSIAMVDEGRFDFIFTSYEYAVVPGAPSFIVLLLGSYCRRRRL